MKIFKFSFVLRTREIIDVFMTLDENIYYIHSKRVNILFLFLNHMQLQDWFSLKKYKISSVRN